MPNAGLPEVAHKDAVIAMLGAGAALAGLILVFLGLVISSYQAYPSVVSQKVKDRVRCAAWQLWAAFALGMIGVALTSLWLVIPGGDSLYWACVVVFAADLLVIVVI